MTFAQHAYEVRPGKDKRGVDLICDALPFGRLWYDGPNVSRAVIQAHSGHRMAAPSFSQAMPNFHVGPRLTGHMML